MNITGYKKSSKIMIDRIKEEESKPLMERNPDKIACIMKAKADCKRRIKELQKKKGKK